MVTIRPFKFTNMALALCTSHLTLDTSAFQFAGKRHTQRNGKLHVWQLNTKVYLSHLPLYSVLRYPCTCQGQVQHKANCLLLFEPSAAFISTFPSFPLFSIFPICLPPYSPLCLGTDEYHSWMPLHSVYRNRCVQPS